MSSQDLLSSGEVERLTRKEVAALFREDEIPLNEG